MSGDPEWRSEAACLGHPNPDLWFPGPGRHGDAAKAVAVCRGCPVIVQCRQWAQRHDPAHGIWGGVTAGERRQFRGHNAYHRPDRWVALALEQHGTEAAYARHRRRGETPCRACRNAKNARTEVRKRKAAAPAAGTQHAHD